MLRTIFRTQKILIPTTYPKFLGNSQQFFTRCLNYRFSTEPNKPTGKKQQSQVSQQNSSSNSKNQSNSNSKTTFTLLGAGLVAALGLGYYLANNYQKQSSIKCKLQAQEKSDSKPQKFGGSWTLIDTEGKPFGSDNLKDYNYIIYFGFTKCPEICPTTLMHLSSTLRMLKSLPESKNPKIKLVFVSVDPERDSPQHLKKYLQKFGKDIIGVSGTSQLDENLKNCMKAFKIYANKIYIPEDDEPNDQLSYTIDHTTIAFLMDHNNQFLDVINPALNELKGAEAILNRIQNNNKC